MNLGHLRRLWHVPTAWDAMRGKTGRGRDNRLFAEPGVAPSKPRYEAITQKDDIALPLGELA